MTMPTGGAPATPPRAVPVTAGDLAALIKDSRGKKAAVAKRTFNAPGNTAAIPLTIKTLKQHNSRCEAGDDYYVPRAVCAHDVRPKLTSSALRSKTAGAASPDAERGARKARVARAGEAGVPPKRSASGARSVKSTRSVRSTASKASKASKTSKLSNAGSRGGYTGSRLGALAEPKIAPPRPVGLGPRPTMVSAGRPGTTSSARPRQALGHGLSSAAVAKATAAYR
eukprot:TRINITY_DN5174_c0_g1_i1.p1 TRINITY_DN5174_c0_g1~~TRINITY_DN5174_c0_g1_i1.p1  ORF type:complete len:226 (+),score=45.97 TRINITY_DN5174_c0_g1_i1:59-736(+)